jgi:hypothetical protein
MSHPSPGALVELHFGEPGPEQDTVLAHVGECRACAALMTDLRRLETELRAGPDDAPPRDGLQRVLARVATVQPARARRAEWARLAAPSSAVLLAAVWAIRVGSERLLALDLVQRFVPAPLAGLAGIGLAAAAVLGVGTLVTLAVAPVLILESDGRS